jgi:large subunit ribosomal protein L30
MTMAKLRITQVKSSINRSRRQKDTLEALGLRKVNQTVEHKDSKQIQGMVRTVQHLVEVEEIA